MICSALYGLSVYPSFELGKLWLSAQVDIQDAVRYRLLFVLTSSILPGAVMCRMGPHWTGSISLGWCMRLFFFRHFFLCCVPLQLGSPPSLSVRYRVFTVQAFCERSARRTSRVAALPLATTLGCFVSSPFEAAKQGFS